MATFNLPGALITANTWFLSPTQTVPASHRAASITATDPNGHWFTRSGNVKAFGIQRQGYVGGPWDNQAPWAGWGWWMYCVPLTGDVVAGIADPAMWLPFGTSVKNDGVHLPLSISVESSDVIGAAGDSIRLAILTDANIRLGAQIVTT